MTIRDLDLERDLADVLALMREVSPTYLINEAALLHRFQTVPARAHARAFVAEVGGRVVGRSQSRYDNFFSDSTEAAFVSVEVGAAHRGAGIGARLFEHALEHADELGVSRLLTMFYENDAGVRFANARGFTEVRAEQESAVDPRLVPVEAVGDLDIRRVADVDPHLVHAVDEAATRDIPSTEQIDAIPYEEWVEHVLEHPLFTAEGSFVVLADGVAAAVSLLLADPETGRAFNMFTGTLAPYRGRGLGRAVKLASIGWAAANGITIMATTNDETNAPMLAINRSLGYVPFGRRVEYLRSELA